MARAEMIERGWCTRNSWFSSCSPRPGGKPALSLHVSEVAFSHRLALFSGEGEVSDVFVPFGLFWSVRMWYTDLLSKAFCILLITQCKETLGCIIITLIE